MKCYRLPAFLLALILGLSPIFAQTADQTEGCAPLQISFTPPAGVSSFFWEFGDNVTSTEENAQHLYINEGTFTVNFRETAGGPILGSFDINVYPKPQIAVTASNPMGCAPLTTQLNSDITIDPNITIFNYIWSYGDGSPSQNGGALTDPTHTYLNPGDFDVFIELETNFSSCNLTEGFVDVVSASGPPNVGFLTQPNPPTSCTAPLVVNFANTTPGQANLNFDWDFGNSSSSTAINPPAQTYTTEGNFTVTLTAVDGNGCSGTTSQVVSIGAPLVDFDFPNDTICPAAAPIQMINNSGAGTYAWTFGAGAFPQTSTQAAPLVQFSQGGLIDVTLEVTSPDGECSGTLTQQIFVDLPDATFTSDPTYSCTKELTAQFTPNNTNAAQYIWSFQGGGTSNDQNPTWTYMNEDTTTHGINGELIFITSLTIVNPSGCFATEFFSDTIHQPNALFLPDVTQGCAPLTVDFDNLSTNDFQITSYLWDFGDGSSQVTNNDDNQVHEYDQPGEYEVILFLTDELGCMDTSFVQTIYVGEPITPSFMLDPVTICAGESVTLSALSNQAEIDGWHFFTDDNRSFHCFQTDELTHIFEAATGTFDVTLEQEYNGCYSQVTVEDLITVQGPIARIDYLVDCENPFDISFRDSSMEATSLMWDFGDMQTATLNDITHTYADTGDYQVILTASNPGTGCPDSKDTMMVHVRDISAEFMLDSLLCLGAPYDLNGGSSQNVEADCYRGYTWTFSDVNDRPVTTQDSVVEHIFEAVGVNFVYLETRDVNGCLANDTMEVRVFGVYPNFVPDPTPICIPATVNFSDFSTADTTLTSWNWDFGDMGTSELVNPVHNYTTFPTNEDSTFTVTLSLQDAIGCGGMLTFDLEVYEPISEISAQPSLNICVGDEINFSASDFTEQDSNLSFNWNFDNGQTSNSQNFTATYPTAGDFDVTLNYFENGSNCAGPEQTVAVSVQEFPVAAFTTDVDGQAILCAPAIINFTDESTSSSPLTVTWDFGNGDTATGDQVSSGFNKGTFIVTETVSTSNGCSDEITREFILVGPEGNFTIDQNEICLGESITFSISDTVDISSWTWDFGDGTTLDNVNPTTHAYDIQPPSGQTTATLVLRGQDDACVITYDTTIFIGNVFADFLAPATGCQDDLIAFSNQSTGASTYLWDFGDGTESTDANPTHAYTAPGTYLIELIATSDIDCLDTLMSEIVIEMQPDISASGDLLCTADEAADLSVTGDASYIYLWSPAALVVDSSAQQTTTIGPLANLPTVFTITATSPISGCVATQEVTVEQVPPLIYPEDFSVTVCPGVPVVLPLSNPEGIWTYSWTFSPSQGTGNPDLCNNCNDPIVTAPNLVSDSIAVFEIIMNASAGDCVDNNIYELRIASNNIPNAFTPDNDNQNDFFNVAFGDEIEITKFQVFNRWGQKVYDNETPATGWDGYYNSNPAASDVYLFIIETDDDSCRFVGDVTLIR